MTIPEMLDELQFSSIPVLVGVNGQLLNPDEIKAESYIREISSCNPGLGGRFDKLVYRQTSRLKWEKVE